MKSKISKETKDKIQEVLFSRAYEIEQELSKDDFFKANLAGINELDIADVALQCAIIEMKKQNNIKTSKKIILSRLYKDMDITNMIVNWTDEQKEAWVESVKDIEKLSNEET